MSALCQKQTSPWPLADEADFGLHLHWCGQCRTWPCNPVLFDLLEKPSMKTACQHPFDPITAPENPLLLYVSVFHGDHIISSTLQVSRANRQAPHVLEPAATHWGDLASRIQPPLLSHSPYAETGRCQRLIKVRSRTDARRVP